MIGEFEVDKEEKVQVCCKGVQGQRCFNSKDICTNIFFGYNSIGVGDPRDFEVASMLPRRQRCIPLGRPVVEA